MENRILEFSKSVSIFTLLGHPSFPFHVCGTFYFRSTGLEQGVSFCDIHYVFLISRFLFESCWLFLALHGSGAICILFLF